MISVGTGTDVGGGHENQDDFFVWKNENETIVVLGVLDGHGHDLGKVAAVAAKKSLLAFFGRESARLRVDAASCLVSAFESAHQAIKERFREVLEQDGLKVIEEDDGYLVKQRGAFQGCVYGGTACSIVAIVDQTVVHVANVGDSSVTLNRIDEHEVLTTEHSPESPSEFCRMRDFRPNPADSRFPAMCVTYDTITSDKTKCQPIFILDVDGVPTVCTAGGKYHKNVRREWATRVSTPMTDRFPLDALAFTRSLGDLHLHTYGVSHVPDVRTHVLSTTTATVCLVLATDGVWDNWTYEDVTKFVLDPSCLLALDKTDEGATRITKAFMERNAIYAKRNFGELQSDNATAILVYLSF